MDRSPLGSARHRESGQAAVEAAIVLPLYVFLLLGTLQLMLMHQARLLTKYAAYKAVRAGSLNNARVSEMEKAALAAVLPLVSRKGSMGGEWIAPIKSGTDFLTKWSWPEVQSNRMLDVGLKQVEVTICGPTTGQLSGLGPEVDFDDPRFAAGTGWQDSERTKLRVQVKFNYRMPIPFANWMIHKMWAAQQIPWMLRTGQARTAIPTDYPSYAGAAATGVYVHPIRATYAMRMQSNIYVNQAPIPGGNNCVFQW